MEYIGIFQGGGMKGIAYIGALIALEENGFICKKAAGTSVGAIIAGLVAAGYNGQEMLYIINNLDFKTLVKSEPNKIKNLISDKGLYSTVHFEEEIDYLLRIKGIYTFNNLRLENDYKLKVIGTNAQKYRQIIFPDDLPIYQISPNLFPVSKAIIMSASYPGYFKPLKLINDYVLDGCLCNNFPYNAFQYQDDDLVIGFQILQKELKNLPSNMNLIKINTNGSKILNFKMSKEEQSKLLVRGYQEGLKMVGKIIEKYHS